MDDQAADRLLGVGDREQLAAATRLAEDAVVADLAAALGIERRPVEDDLGLAVAGQLVELHAVADDRDDPALRRRRLVAEERRVADARLDGAVQRGQLGVLRELGLRAGPRALALFGQGDVEPVAIDPDAVLGGELDGQVDREAVRVVELERDVAGQDRRIGGQRVRLSTDDGVRAAVGLDLRDLRLEQPGPRIERPRELRLLAADDAEDLVPPRHEERVRLAHDVDDDGRGLGHERLAPAEQAAVPDRAPEQLAQDVAAALVRGQHVIGDQERHRARVVGDDLVAEPLALERVRVVPQELAHPGVDRREQVRVVVGRDLLEHARQALQAQARCRRSVNGSGTRLSGSWSNSMNTRFQISSQRGHVSEWSGMQCGPSENSAPRSKWISLHGPHGPVSAIRQKLASSPLSTSPQRAIRSGGRPISSRPDVPGHVVVRVGRGRQPLARDAEVAGQEVPGPVDRLALEVVAERPVAEHLEERVMAGRPADLLEVVVLAGDAQDSAGSRPRACTTGSRPRRRRP